jgi:hypothetical protein
LFEPAASANGLLPPTQDAPRPFLLLPPLPGRRHTGWDERPVGAADWRQESKNLATGRKITFGLTLLGPAIAALPYFVYATQLFADNGLGADRAPFALTSVAAIDETGGATVIYAIGEARLRPHPAAKPLSEWVTARVAELEGGDTLNAHFLTPLRLRQRQTRQEAVNFAQLCKAASLRLSLLWQLYGATPLVYDYQQLLALAREARTVAADFSQLDWSRYSNRQGRKIAMDGLLGTARYASPNMREFLPLLAAGELLQIGSGTALGLGRYRLAA